MVQRERGQQDRAHHPNGHDHRVPDQLDRSRPYYLALGSDGNLWFTESGGSRIGRITTQGAITEYQLPLFGEPIGIVSGPGRNLWFTDLFINRVGRITTDGSITEFPPVGEAGPAVITAGPSKDALWIAGYNGDNLLRLRPGSP